MVHGVYKIVTRSCFGVMSGGIGYFVSVDTPNLGRYESSLEKVLLPSKTCNQNSCLSIYESIKSHI